MIKMRRWKFKVNGLDYEVEAGRFHTALYRLGLILENNGYDGKLLKTQGVVISLN
jgi:hypothetical protein